MQEISGLDTILCTRKTTKKERKESAQRTNKKKQMGCCCCCWSSHSADWSSILLVVAEQGKTKFSLSPFAPREFGLARRVQPSRPASARSFSTPRLNLVQAVRHTDTSHLRAVSRLYSSFSTKLRQRRFKGTRVCPITSVPDRSYSPPPIRRHPCHSIPPFSFPGVCWLYRLPYSSTRP